MHNDKIKVVLNKSDQIEAQELMRVYGALMWSLGKVFGSPEVCRVYLGSFNADRTVRPGCELEGLFRREQEALLNDLLAIPSKAGDRKVSEFVRRVRALQVSRLRETAVARHRDARPPPPHTPPLAPAAPPHRRTAAPPPPPPPPRPQIHIAIVAHLRKQLPALMGKAKAQRRLLEQLPEEFLQIQRAQRLPPGDFPDPFRYKELLSAFELADFPKQSQQHLDLVEGVLEGDIPRLLAAFDNPF